MSLLQLLGIEKMKYQRDGGEYGVIGEWLSTPPLPRDCIIKLVNFEDTGEQNYYFMHDYKISRLSTILAQRRN